MVLSSALKIISNFYGSFSKERKHVRKQRNWSLLSTNSANCNSNGTLSKDLKTAAYVITFITKDMKYITCYNLMFYIIYIINIVLHFYSSHISLTFIYHENILFLIWAHLFMSIYFTDIITKNKGIRHIMYSFTNKSGNRWQG